MSKIIYSVLSFIMMIGATFAHHSNEKNNRKKCREYVNETGFVLKSC